jgi:hypothetical protein
MLSLNETARRHDVSKAGLSQAVHAGRPIKGMSLHRFAVVEEGEIQGFEFPDWYSIPEEEEGEEEEETIYMTMAELCREHSAFHRGKVEHALRKGWPVDGFPLHEWVVHDEGGSWDGFEVPKSADFDGRHPPNALSTKGNSESGEKDVAQEDSPNETALSGNDFFDEEESDDKSGEDEPDGGSKAAQGLLALGGAIAVSALTNG